VPRLDQSARIVVQPIGTTANADSRTIRQTMEALADNMNVTKDQMIARIASLPTGEAGTVSRLTFGHSYGPRGRARPDPPMN
jgi:hypothetical protein